MYIDVSTQKNYLIYILLKNKTMNVNNLTKFDMLKFKFPYVHVQKILK